MQEAPLPAKRVNMPIPSAARTKIVRELFLALTGSISHDGSGRIKSEAMRNFATLNGFEGSDREWTDEFESLCEEWKCGPQDGFDEQTFMKLVSDDSDMGCYCSDEELSTIAHKLLARYGAVGVTAAG